MWYEKNCSFSKKKKKKKNKKRNEITLQEIKKKNFNCEE